MDRDPVIKIPNMTIDFFILLIIKKVLWLSEKNNSKSTEKSKTRKRYTIGPLSSKYLTQTGRITIHKMYPIKREFQ